MLQFSLINFFQFTCRSLAELSNAFTSFFGGGADSDSASTEGIVEEVPTETNDFPTTDSTEPSSNQSSHTQTTDDPPNSDEADTFEGPGEPTGSNEGLPEGENVESEEESVESEEPTASNEGLPEEHTDESEESKEPAVSKDGLPKGDADESDSDGRESIEAEGKEPDIEADENPTRSNEGLNLVPLT